ncbi:tyrosine-type recombinase/integrase [Eubacterium ventriosum]|jgi:integrase|uniref:tyrosine-type recombinase/integrase n=1 Tax=Eubacterium ventriosum TaxID=39496 RepID=UPI000E50B800|nr:site-specific integrase [Eubacterium ventriosum]RHD17692.1 site-specific integrase [Eubacterium ventriosum]
MRRANGSGSIFKVKDAKRRKPWRVNVTLGVVINEETGKARQRTASLGYFATRAEAEEALVNYNACPYDLKAKDYTFAEVYKIWSTGYFKKLTGVSSERSVRSAYSYAHELYDMKMRDIRSYHLKECIDNAYIIVYKDDKKEKKPASAGTKERLKSVFNLMFDWAYEHEIVVRNYARAFRLDKDIVRESRTRKREIIIFSEEEIKLLWGSRERLTTVDMILIGIYSGWRPQELATLKIADIDLENEVMYGGSKTEAGRNRTVPIHPLIKPLIEEHIKKSQEIGCEYLFSTPNSQTSNHMTYDKYRVRFCKTMKALGLNHHPHETRHTFITRAKQVGMDEYILKRIVGHAMNDITEAVYTHRDFADLKEAIRLIKE